MPWTLRNFALLAALTAASVAGGMASGAVLRESIHPRPVAAAAQRGSSLPACPASLVRRRGNDLFLTTADLDRAFNQKLHAARYNFSDLQLRLIKSKNLMLRARQNGQSFSISGPFTVARPGVLQLHAAHISKGGSSVKLLMSLVGNNLRDYFTLSRTSSLHVKGNNLLIYPDRLLGVKGRVTRMELQGNTIRLNFDQQPCR